VPEEKRIQIIEDSGARQVNPAVVDLFGGRSDKLDGSLKARDFERFGESPRGRRVRRGNEMVTAAMSRAADRKRLSLERFRLL